MKKKLKTSLLSLGIAIPTIASLVSCGAKVTRFDQVNDNKIVLAHSFSSTGPQKEALDKIALAWNDYVEKNSNQGLMKLEIRALNGGYDGALEDMDKKINVGAKDDLWNLMFNYPVTASILKKYDMGLSLSDKNIEEFKKEKIDAQFENVFLEFNTRIANLDKEEIWALPSSRSSQVLTINTPVMSYIIKEAQEGVKDSNILEKDKEYFNSKIIKPGEKDKERVKAIWKEYKSIPESEGGLKGYKFSKDIFSSYEKLFDLSSRIKKAFPKSQEGNIKDKVKSIFGIDSLANVIYSMALSKVDGDYNRFLLSLNENKTGIDYKTLLNDKNSEKQKVLKEVFERLKQNILDNSIFIKTGADYSSIYFKNHQMAFALSSTAGFKHNFVKKNSNTYQYIFRKTSSTPDVKETSELINGSEYDSYILKTTAEEKQEGKIAKIISLSEWNKNQSNGKFSYILDSKADEEGNIPEEQQFLLSLYTEENSYNIIATPEMKTAIETLEKETTTTAPGKEYLGILTTADLESRLETLKDIIAFGDGKAKYKKWNLSTDQLEDNKYAATILKAQNPNFEVITYGGNQVVNEEELFATIAPTKWKENETKNIITSQGPSLIGIHANEKEDKVTKEFVKWFINQKINFSTYELEYEKSKDQNWEKPENWEEQATTTEMTPIQYFAIKGSYIVPTKDYLGNVNNYKEITDYLDNNKNKYNDLTSKKAQESNAKKYKTLLDELNKAKKDKDSETQKKKNAENFIKRLKDKKEMLSSKIKDETKKTKLEKLIDGMISKKEEQITKNTKNIEKQKQTIESKEKEITTLKESIQSNPTDKENIDFIDEYINKQKQKQQKGIKLDLFTKVTLEKFNDAINQRETNILYEDPTDALAANFRNTLEGTFSSMATGADAEKNKDFKSFMEKLNDSLGASFKRR